MKKNKELEKLGFNNPDNLFMIENDCFQDFVPYIENGEILPTYEALKNRPEIKDKLWKLIDPQKDNATREVFKNDNLGYYIKSFTPQKKENKSYVSIESCLFTSKNSFTQNIHNLIIAEENSSLEIMTGCISDKEISANIHNGVTEIYVGKHAKVIFTMIHVWRPTSKVFPRTAVIVEEGGAFISNYILLEPIGKIQSNPQVYLNGINSKTVLNTFVFSHPKCKIDLGGTIYHNAKGTKGEIISNLVINGGNVLNKGFLIGNSPKIKSHIECKAIILNDNAKFVTIPTLESHFADLDMSHEAAIGKISQEEIEYLQTKGIHPEKAKQLIIRGFIDKSLGNLSEILSNKIDYISSISSKGM